MRAAGDEVPMSVLELRQVTRLHGRGRIAVHAVRNSSLTVEAGEPVAVMAQLDSGTPV